MKLLGILSGSGPEAGLAIIKDMHIYLQSHYGAVLDHEYPDYILYNKPLVGFGPLGVEDANLVYQSLIEALEKLHRFGVDYIGIACNSLHTFYDILPSDLQQKIIHMPYETVAACKEYKKVLVLSSSSARGSGLYTNIVNGLSELLSVSDVEQCLLDSIIEHIMGGDLLQSDISIIQTIISEYQFAHHIDAVILGCTELPVLFRHQNVGIPIISSNTILAKLLVEKAKQ